MSKDLEQLRLNMIRTLMEMDYDSLNEVKAFLETMPNSNWKEFINDESVEFIDYSKMTKKTKEENDSDKTKIMFL
ncbi:MAG: hypothetical protein ACPGVH_03680 [Chitinophagales bacterium]